MLESLLLKLQPQGPATLLKKTLTQVFPCETCKHLEFTNFQNKYFEEHLSISASKLYLRRDSNTGVSPEFCELFKNTYSVEDLQMSVMKQESRGLSLISLQV